MIRYLSLNHGFGCSGLSLEHHAESRHSKLLLEYGAVDVCAETRGWLFAYRLLSSHKQLIGFLSPSTGSYLSICSFHLLQVAELQTQLTDAAHALEQQRRTAAQASAGASAATAKLTASQEEADRQAARVVEVEQEMQALLTAVEAQKAASTAKMRQLASLLHEV